MYNVNVALPFGFVECQGLVFTTESSACSAIAVTFLLVYVGVRGASCTWSASIDVHYYFLDLLMFDLIEAIGEHWAQPPVLLCLTHHQVVSIRWIADAVGPNSCIFSPRGADRFCPQRVTKGALCTAQGAFRICVLHAAGTHTHPTC